MKKELASAVADAKAALEQRARIRQEIAKAEQERREIEGESEVARAQLAEAEAAAVLDNNTKASASARKVLAAIRVRAETVEARLIGLRARLARTETDIPDRLRKLRQANHAAFVAARSEWESRWRDAVESLRLAALGGFALQQAFGTSIQGLDTAREALDGSLVDSEGKAIARLSPNRFTKISFDLAPGAQQTIEQYADVRKLERTLDKVRQEIDDAAFEEQQRQKAAERRAKAVAS